MTNFADQSNRVSQATKSGSQQNLAYRVPRGRGGVYYLEVKITAQGSGRYTLSFSKS